MALLAPWFLLGGLAVGLPLWLHLLDRENPVRLPFSSLMFFEKRRQSSMKQRRFRYRMLMAARIALYSLLALAFTKPVWELAAGAGVGDVPGLHIIALDTSLSMNYSDRWDRAVAGAGTVIDDLKPADKAQILAIGPGVQVVTEPIGDQSELRAALQSLRPTPSRNSYGDMAEAVRTLAPDADVPVTVHLFSDFQSSAMPGRFSDVALPTMATLEVHNLAEAESPNWTIESIKGTTRIFGGRNALIEATVAGFGTPETRKTVTLLLNGKEVARRSVDVPAAGRASVVFEGFEPPAGNNRGELVLEPADDLPLDDKRLIAIRNAEPSTILFVHSDARRRDLTFFSAALDASAQAMFRVEGVSVTQAEQSRLDAYSLLILSDVPQLSREASTRFETYVKAGGSVLVVLGPKATLAGKAALMPEGLEEFNYTARDGQRFQFAGSVDESHPVLGQLERFQGVKFYRYAKLPVGPEDDVLARLSDGSPLLIERPMGAGRVLILASSLDNIWNDLPIHPVFVPFVLETARYLSGLDQSLRQLSIDSILELAKGRGSGVQVFDPHGERMLSLADSAAGEDLRLTELGFYELRRAGATELAAVNADPRESNLRPIEADLVSMWEATGRNDASEPVEGEESLLAPPPLKLWKLFLLLLVIMTLVESVIGNYHLKVQREV
ncbi:MAG: BatA and WFA domain-containing protein [Acidobacteria bacterium]|nr:BatA and WFA domain-containing protein [Acidobacteriota bacterium]